MTQANGLALEQRVELVEARFAIADLVNEYARLIRSDRSDEVARLFTDDAVFETRDGHPDKPDSSVRSRLEGRETIGAFMAEGKGKPHPVPLIHNLTIEIDGDTARGNCVMEGQICGTDLKVSGEYHDTFRRVEGRWLFASRTFTLFGGAPSL